MWTHSGRMSVQMVKRPSHLHPHIRTPDLNCVIARARDHANTMRLPSCENGTDFTVSLCRRTSFHISTSQIWVVLSETKRLPPNTAAITAAGISIWAVSHSSPAISRYLLHCNKIWRKINRWILRERPRAGLN